MKLGIFSTHPIQYQVPLWRAISENSGWDVQVFYFSDQGVSKKVDPGFNRVVTWDIPLLDGYKYEFLSKKPVKDANSFEIPCIDDFMESHRFDVVLIHGYTHRFARQILQKKRRFGYKVVMRGEFTEMPRRKFDWKKIPRQIYLNWFYRHVDHFCPIGKDAVSHLKKYGIDELDTTLAPYSVDSQFFENQRASLDKQVCRDSLGIGKDKCVFLFSGKLIPRKQPLLLAEAVQKLYIEYPQLTVIYLGSGPQFEELKHLLKPKLGSRLILPGFVNQLKLGLYFKSADVFVLPSTYDTWGLVVNEAMHFALPCIVSDMVGSRHDLVINGETGLVFDHKSSTKLASCMQNFLDEDNLSDVMGSKANELIQNYTIEKTVDGIETAIRSVS